MFEVVCIQLPKQPNTKIGTKPIVKIGSRYNVVREFDEDDESYAAYELAEHRGVKYAKYLFATLNGPDERERLTQEDKMLMALAEHMPDEQLDPVAEARIWKAVKAAL